MWGADTYCILLELACLAFAGGGRILEDDHRRLETSLQFDLFCRVWYTYWNRLMQPLVTGMQILAHRMLFSLYQFASITGKQFAFTEHNQWYISVLLQDYATCPALCHNASPHKTWTFWYSIQHDSGSLFLLTKSWWAGRSKDLRCLNETCVDHRVGDAACEHLKVCLLSEVSARGGGGPVEAAPKMWRICCCIFNGPPIKGGTISGRPLGFWREPIWAWCFYSFTL